MAINDRRSGIELIGNVPWGTHFCQFYKTKEDLVDILVPYFKAGLEDNEFCMWVTAEPLNEKEAAEAMRKAMPDFNRYLKSGQLEIIPYTEWYLKGGAFDSPVVLNGWIDKLNQALSNGYAGLRLSGNTFWLEKRDWRNFTHYEEEINSVIGKYQMIALCTYSLDKCRASGVIDVIQHHQFALIRQEGQWKVLEDIERKRMGEKLQESEEKLRRMFESVADGIVVIDLNGAIVEVNERALEMGNLHSKDELLGKAFNEFIAPSEHEKAITKMQELLERGTVRDVEFTAVRPDGSGFPFEVSGNVLRDASDNPIGFIVVMRDITERKRMQAQLLVTDRLASLGELASGIAHELNNPLTSIIGFAQLLLVKDLSDDVKEDVKVINKEAKRTAEVVRNFLTFARKYEPERKPVDVNNVIQTVLALRAYEQKVNNIQVDTRFASDLPEVMADDFQLQQVFLNIVINAEHFMIEAHGKGNLNITTERVGDIIRASFADDGPGIAKENIGHLFDPFFTTREVGKGTGLGLSICHGVIAEHGGRIYAESKLGKGATFVVELPVGK